MFTSFCNLGLIKPSSPFSDMKASYSQFFFDMGWDTILPTKP